MQNQDKTVSVSSVLHGELPKLSFAWYNVRKADIILHSHGLPTAMADYPIRAPRSWYNVRKADIILHSHGLPTAMADYPTHAPDCN